MAAGNIGTFCDSVLRILSSYEYSKSEALYERRDVQQYINDGIGYVVDKNFIQNYNLGDLGNVDPGFLQTYEDVPVLFSDSRNQWYAILPCMPIALPSGLGLFEVAPMQNTSDAFIPLQPGSSSLYKGLESERLFGEKGYRQEGLKLLFVNDTFAQQANPAVLINIISDTSNLTLDDPLPIPPNYVGQVREAVVNFMTKGLQAPADTNINSTPDNRKQ